MNDAEVEDEDRDPGVPVFCLTSGPGNAGLDCKVTKFDVLARRTTRTRIVTYLQLAMLL
ncbi:hypothetical protein HZF08_10735 [Paenibacillus sp. CGMCC 1.16610]|uniref:hypothetical protein n=1 Tax=Paenibacillus anseongense TaxID=2682845 RepID=UPI001625C37F|nr:hypothetical protein [Paenibacillus anseongense]MBA2938782.1 hypothetical protein [Paenibacillus sp. CGMCC 1.16610]